MNSTRPLSALVLGVAALAASCASSDPGSDRPPNEIWLKADDLDDLRDSPGGRSITDWRLAACTGFRPGHVPGAFVAQRAYGPDGRGQHYVATGAQGEHGTIAWWQYRPSR
jgi:hypothetical protein